MLASRVADLAAKTNGHRLRRRRPADPPKMGGMNRAVLYALLAAALFGASAPLAKRLIGEISPVLMGGLLYLGSGVGLSVGRLLRDGGWKASGLAKGEWPWLLGAIFFGGIVAPVALLSGLTRISGSTASLLLNLEAVLTAAIAWVVFKENADRRVVLDMAAIVAGGVVLSWPSSATGTAEWVGPTLIAAACACWAIDNNLTRKGAASDALFIAGSKGLVAGVFNTLLAITFGASLPGVLTVSATLLLGFLGYGLSLVLFVLALRGLGTARTGAYFSVAPFVGAAVAIGVLGEVATQALWLAATLMAVGVWLHLTEHHAHFHTHDAAAHEHSHSHDEHHQHAHDVAMERVAATTHSHPHEHAVLTHKHPHFPDIQHRHHH